MKDRLEDLAKEERREYHREWRRKNKDKVKKYNQSFWENRAKKKLAEKGDVEEC